MGSSAQPTVPTQGGAKRGSAHCRAFLYWTRSPGDICKLIRTMWLKHLHKPHLLISSSLGIKKSIYEFGGDTFKP